LNENVCSEESGKLSASYSPLQNPAVTDVTSGCGLRDDLPARARLIVFAVEPIRYAGAEKFVKILLVEDSMAIRQENERVLLKAGYEVVCAKDGESALKFAREQRPELILLDMILPKMSGPEVLKQLKKDSATSNIPVIVLSSLSEKNRQKLIEAGADEYVEKSTLSPMPGTNLLPNILEDVICRINRKRGIAFSSIPVDKAGG
jgi:CheY-like chemotaxis protein